MKKRILSIVTAALMTAALLAGCGSTGESTSSTKSSSSGSGTTAKAEQSSDASTTDSTGSTGSGKTLVLYYSASGNTKNVADLIAKDTGADEYEVTPADPYTDEDLDWTDKSSRVNKEHDDASLQDVKFNSTDVPNWDSYDTVFVGYPIWWQDASWVMKSFVKQVDFSGKTVIPFCTSISSDIGKSGSNLAQIAGTGNWQDGKRFSGSVSDSDVQDWVSSLNLK